jgi:hypothetical protein
MKKVFYVGILALCLSSCVQKASIDMTVDGAPSEKLAVYKLNVSSGELLDSVSTDAAGHFRYSVKVEENQPEFIYVYRGNTILSTLLLEKGEKAVVKADTLGNFSVEGSQGSVELASVTADYNAFLKQMSSLQDPRDGVKIYLDYYRSRTSYVINHCKSLSVIPVLFQPLYADTPVFSQPTDAILFRKVCDSLKTVYPESRYVKALEQETKTRENQLSLNLSLSQAQSVGFPELQLPDINGEKVSLSGVKAKAILVHFWSDQQDAQKLLNTEVLLPLYREYHRRGFEIYSVCVSTDKALWASVVRNQNLPWINVCDGLGTGSTAVALYNVQSLPYSLLIADDEISAADIDGAKSLRSELDKILK